jgi:glycosyltransferase involved in cell wall biosynthesis
LVTVYNEVETVEKAINDVINLKYPHKEILVIDNGSTDGSQKIIKKFKGIKKILKKKNFGVGNSVVEGIKKAKGKYIYTQHADLEYDHLRSLYMLKYAEKNKLDVVFATRLKKKDFILKKIIKKPAYLATIICTFLINKFYGKEFNDIIGVKLYRKSSLIQIPLNCNNTGFEFYSVSKFIFISSNTVYPVSDLAMKESDAQFNFFEKYHIVGWMKRFSEIVCEIYSKKIKNKMKTIIIRPGNLYGPHDKFEPKKSKVIPSLISRISARQDPINVWGDGKDLKDFLYIEDFCNILVKIINRVNSFEIYNVASGKSVTIQKILKILIKIENLNNNKIYYDVSKPTMIPKRLISIMKIKKQFKFKPSISLHEGLARTVKWYKKKRIYDNHKNTV